MLQNLMQHETVFVEIALALFLMVFLSVVLREWMRSKREVKHMADLPLQDDNEALRQ